MTGKKTKRPPPPLTMADFTDPEMAAERIRQHRTSALRLTVRHANGMPAAGLAVAVKQLRHRFRFGTSSLSLPWRDNGGAREIKQRIKSIFNAMTINDIHWPVYEPEPGLTRAAAVRKLATWCRTNGIVTKGHPICWHEGSPDWIKALPLADAEALQWQRVEDLVSEFNGLIDSWEVLNESVVMPEYVRAVNHMTRISRRIGRTETIRRAFAAAREANNQAELIINDYVVSSRYHRAIRHALTNGAAIDVIGIQSHMQSGYWGAQKLFEICTRFSDLGKPLHFTETSLVSGRHKQRGSGLHHRKRWPSTPRCESRQAEQAAEYYTLLFSHPRVDAITWWDFTDAKSWMGAPAGLLRRDLSPKPAYDALRDLIKKQWWSGTQRAVTDQHGRIDMTCFLGDYELRTDRKKRPFSVTRAGRYNQLVILD